MAVILLQYSDGYMNLDFTGNYNSYDYDTAIPQYWLHEPSLYGETLTIKVMILL